MSDEQNDQGGNDSGETPAAPTFSPITSQDDLNKIISERVQRERAKYAGFDELKAKASQFDELEQSKKSELDKATERLAALEAERDAERSASLRFRIAAKHGISDEDADLFLTGTDEETLKRQAERLAGREADRKKQGNHVPREGGNPKPPNDPEREAARQLFAS